VTQLHRFVTSPLGPIRLSAASSGRLSGLRIGRDAGPESQHHCGLDAGPAARRVLDDAAAQLDEYFEGVRRSFDLPLSLEGSSFQRQVWAHLQMIPFGTTMSYGQLAAALGRSGAARAVGHANARNPIPVIVPCHRVIGCAGQLTGYGGGLDAKRHLLDFEAQWSPSGVPADTAYR
jgi:methylated-DNA-[protein]-cysteine S-methyltransferase